MNLFNSYIQRIIMLAVVVSIMVACSSESELSHEQQNGEGRGYVSLRISTGVRNSGTRAVPLGGEYGDGLEPGQHQENDINTLSLFAYQGGINASASTPVRLVAYLSDLNLKISDAIVEDGMFVYDVRVDNHFINDYEFKPADKFVVVANTPAFAVATLGDLRDTYVSLPVARGAAGEPPSKCHDFVMSNERESEYVDGTGAPDDPRLIKVNIERVTARIDLITDGSVVDNETNSLLYSVNDGLLNQKVAELYLSHARVFNGMRAPSYLIKRLAQSSTAPDYYLQDEAKPATQFVVEPNTWKKGTDDASLFSQWYGDSHIGVAASTGDSWFCDAHRVHTAAPSASDDGFGGSTSVDANGKRYYVMDYVNENTMTPANTTSEVTTGVMLRGIYKPLKVYKGIDLSNNPVLDTEYAYGQTFWRYRPIQQTYDETKALYFSNEAAAVAYRAAHPEVQSEITKFTDAKCYYPVYLRHDNTVSTVDIHTMEYGIVRNNIYRLQVSFTGPGYPVMTTEINPEGIRPYIFVRKWYKINHPEIEI